jgi:hypothetical protein
MVPRSLTISRFCTQGLPKHPAKSFRRDILEGTSKTTACFHRLTKQKNAGDIPSVSPLEGIFYEGISKKESLFSKI